MKGFIIELSYFDNPQTENFTVKKKKGESVFMTLFRDSLDDLGKLYWYSAEAPFASTSAMNEEEVKYFFDTVVEDFEKCNNLCQPHALFPKYARWIRDDNNLLFGFNNKPSSDLIKKVFHLLKLDAVFVDNNVDAFFSNQDAVFWECFAKDEVLLNKCLESVLKVADKKFITFLNLSERENFYKKS